MVILGRRVFLMSEVPLKFNPAILGLTPAAPEGDVLELLLCQKKGLRRDPWSLNLLESVQTSVGTIPQGYLAHTQTPLPRTLQEPCAWGPMVVLGGWAFSHERGTPVCRYG